MVTLMVKLFTIEVNDLHDPRTTLSFVTPLIGKMFFILPDILHEPFLVSTLVGEFVVTKRVYKIFQ